MTKRIKLVVAYDGTDFCGWAAQTGRRTVQSTLTEAVRRISGEDCEIVGASRTDSGAHAKGQTCHFDTSIPTANWKSALNQSMTTDVRVMSASVVPSDFHARFMARDRFYRYVIVEECNDPFRLRYAHSVRWKLDVDAMQAAAALFEGEHDFRAFTADLSPRVENTVRRLFSVKVKRLRDETRVEICGTAFLRGMMRRISGSLMEVGRGTRSLESIATLLSSEWKREYLPEVLPAKGLTLLRVAYGRHPMDCRDRNDDSE